MCFHYITVYSCGHFLPSSDMETRRRQYDICEPTMIALKYFHDQRLYLSIEGLYAESSEVLACPSPCPLVYRSPRTMHAAIRENHRDSIEYLYRRMATNGIDQHERDRVRDLAGIPNRDSNRNVPNSRQGLQPFPLRMLQHVNDLRAWQQWPGKLFSDVPQHVHHGCGCNENAACLRGWTAADIIMFRAGAFNDIGRQVGILTIDYGSVRIHTPVGGMPAARAQIQVPLYAAMHSVLVALSGSSGPGIRANSPLKTPRSFTIQLAGPNFARPLPYPRVFNPTMPPFIPLLARSFPARALLPTRSSRDPNPRPERSAALQELTEAQIQSEAEAESAENNA